ncbi:MAG: DUF3224 domain-containing protein [Anaerolineales bacterium]
MNKKIYISLALVIMLSLATIPVFASPPANASGIWYYIPTELVFIKEAGGNEFFDLTEAGIWTGTFEGTSIDYGPVVFHRSGVASFRGIVDFEGEVEGKTGTLMIKVNGRKSNPTADWEGHWVIISGGGQLSDLKGQGKWWGPGYNPANPETYGVIHYSGKIH